MPGETVSKAWLAEFYRLKGKIYYDHNDMVACASQINELDESLYTPLNIFD